MSKKKVLIFISHYLPGYKMGGPVNSIFNISLQLKDEFDFYVITSSRDLGEDSPYREVKTDKFIAVNHVKVMYCDTKERFYSNIISHLKNNVYDTIYLNSLFEFKFSLFIILLKYFRIIRTSKIILAPRGELFKEALLFGKFKKTIFLKLVNILKVYNNVIWHSTAEVETSTIKLSFSNSRIKLARVISDFSNTTLEINEPEFVTQNESVLKLIFLSRISKEKNLIYAIKLLSKISYPVELHIYGPIEDQNVWRNCLIEIKLLPVNITVAYKGEVIKKLVKSYFSKYDIFFFPTHLENYGHVINEALSVGTPVLISDNTPWRKMEFYNLGWDFNLKREEDFIKVLSEYSQRTEDDKKLHKLKVIDSYLRYIDKDTIIKENLELFKN